MVERAIWVGSIVIDCTDLPQMIALCQEDLHYVRRDPPSDDGVVLKDPQDHRPNLSLNRTTGAKGTPFPGHRTRSEPSPSLRLHAKGLVDPAIRGFL